MHRDRFSGCLFIVQPKKKPGPAGRSASKGKGEDSILDTMDFIHGSFDIVISMQPGRDDHRRRH
jgi:hypothetical protein